MTNNLVAILALREVKGVGASAIKKLYSNNLFDNSGYYQIMENSLRILKKEITDSEIEENINYAKELIHRNQLEDVHVLELSNEKYPSLLRESKSPPSVLYYKGDLRKAEKTIGIIGTREASQKTNEIAKRISQYFSDAHYSICNGLAVGIDEACISMDSGIRSNVVGVVAGGLNFNKTKTLLKTTAALAEKVLDSGGLVVSEYPINVKEDTFKVVDSCVVQAGLSQALVLVQSKADGGSRYTLKGFAELNRALGVISIPEIKDDPTFEANNLLISNSNDGLAKITNLKSEKIAAKIIPIASRSDYDKLMSVMNANSPSGKSLFD